MKTYSNLIVVQASTVSWRGDVDPCFYNLDGNPVIFETLKRIRQQCSDLKIVVVAPEYDRGGELTRCSEVFENVDNYFGNDESPLERLIGVCEKYQCSHLIRVDGLHFCVDLTVAMDMLNIARNDDLDCIKLPDDFPVHYTSDVYSRNGLLLARDEIAQSGEKKYEIHPKYLMFKNSAFKTREHELLPEYSIEYMRENRAVFQKIRFPRHQVTKQAIALGDLASFHYEIACGYLNKEMNVLDVACGTGYGSCMMASFVKSVVGADLEVDVIAQAASENSCNENIKFVVENVENLSFGNQSFDAVVSMETIDYVDENLYLNEVRRVLKPGGLFVLSTQQNRAGYLSVNSVSETGYTLETISSAVNKFFEIVHVYSFKAGRIQFENDHVGRNLILVAKRIF